MKVLLKAPFETAAMPPVATGRRICWADCNRRQSMLRRALGFPRGPVAQVPAQHQRIRPSPALSLHGVESPPHKPDESPGHHPSSAIAGQSAHLSLSATLSPLALNTSDQAPHPTTGDGGSVHQALHTLRHLAACLHASSGISSPEGIPKQDRHHQALQQSYETVMHLLQTLPQCPDAYHPPSNFPVVLMTLYHVHDLLTPCSSTLSSSSSPPATSADHDISTGDTASYPWSELLQTGLSLYALKAPWHVGSFTNSRLDTLLEQCVSKDAQGFAISLWKRVTAAVPQYRSLQELRSISSLCETMLSPAAPEDPFVKAMGPTAVGAREACHALLCNTVHCSLHSTARLLPTSPAPHLASRELIDAIRAFNWRLRSTPTTTASFTSRSAPAVGARAPTILPPLQPFVPSRSWVSAVLSAALNTREVLQPQQVSHLLSDLQELSSRGQSSSHSSSPVTMLGASRVMSTVKAASTAWVGVLDPSGQVAVQAAVVRHREIWEPQEMAALLLTLCVRGGSPPDSELCGLISDTINVLPGFGATQEVDALFRSLVSVTDNNSLSSLGGDGGVEHGSSGSSSSVTGSRASSGGSSSGGSSSSSGMGSNISLLCTLLHDAAHLVSRGHTLSPSHRALINTTFNKLIYLMGTESPLPSRHAPAHASPPHPSPSLWQNCSFLFDQYPKLLEAGISLGMPPTLLYHDTYLRELQRYITTAPSQELVLRGPEGLTRALKAASLIGPIADLSWAWDFESACTTLIDVQLTVGFTHPLRWTPLFNAVLAAMPGVPMPRLAAAARCLCVRFCRMESHADHMWALLPVLGRLENAVEAASSSSAVATGLLQMTHAGMSQANTHVHSSGNGTHAQPVSSLGVSSGQPAWKPRMTSGVAPASGSSSAAAAAKAALEEQLRKYAVSGIEYEAWIQSVGRHLASSLSNMSTAARARHYRDLKFSWNQMSILRTVDFSDL